MPLLSTRGAASARGFGLLGRVKAITDPFFNYVTMLLHGDGTNGAQNNTFLDSSTNNFTITRNGNTTQGSFSPYGPNWSNFFDGAGDYLTASYSTSAFDWWTSDYTLEAWIYPNTLNGWSYEVGGVVQGTLVGNATPLSTTNFWSFGVLSNGTVRFSYFNGSNILVSSTATVSSNAWNHIAMTKTSSGITIWVNGVGNTVTAVSGTPQSSTGTALAIGQINNTGIDGYVSNVRIVKGTAVYTANFTPSTTPLTAISGTSLLTCADNRFIDDSTNNFTITPSGNPSVQRFSPFQPTAAYNPATIGGSGYFNGTTDYLNTPAVAALDLDGTNYTIEAWVYLDGSKTTNTMVFADPYYVLGISLNRTGAGDTYVYTGDGTNWTGVPALISSSNLRFRCWNHVAFVQNAVQIALYHNGVQVAATSNGGLFPSGFNGRMFVGAVNDATEKFAGYMSGVRITRSALYNSTFTPPATPFTQSGSLLLNYTNGAIFDNAMMNDLETVGNAQISTSVVKYGTGSISFNGTNSNLLGPISQNTVFPGNFTVEFWVYKNADKDFNVYFDNRATVGSATGFSIASNSSGQFALFTNNSFAITSASSYATATWFHIAVVRSGSTITLYVNGVSVGTSTNSTAFTDGRLGVGYSLPDAMQYVNGYIDDMRITKGVARYTANFTPPTAAFPNN